jgi:hypothetical protein
MSKPTGPLAPTQSPLQTVRDELAAAIEESTPVGAFAAGCQRLEAIAAEHPETAPGIAASLTNLRAEFRTFAAVGNGGAISDRLTRLENEVRAQLGRPNNIYTPIARAKESMFPPPRPERHLGGIANPKNYPHLRLLDALNEKLKQG